MEIERSKRRRIGGEEGEAARKFSGGRILSRKIAREEADARRGSVEREARMVK